MTDWKIVEKGEAGKAVAGRAGEDLRDAPRRRAVLRRRRGAFAQARSAGEAHPHRGQEPRSRQAVQHQGKWRWCSEAEYAALLVVELTRAGRFPRRDIAAPPRHCRRGGRG